MASTIKIDWAAVDKVIGSTMRSRVDELAAQVAANVDVGSVTDAQVTVGHGSTKWGWPVAWVTIAHPAGQAMEAKHGALTRAAASAGLTVKAKS